MTEPTLSDCINYMKQQLKGMEKYPKSYEFNIPYYRKTIEYLGELNSKIEKSKSEIVIVPDYRDGWRMKEGEAE